MRNLIPFFLCCLLALTQPAIADQSFDSHPYSVLNSGPWELRVFCNLINPESLHGVLLKEGKKVKGENVGEIIETNFPGDMKRLKYYGSYGNISGWYFVDIALGCNDLPTD